MSDVLNQIKQKIETTVKSGIETVEHLVGIGKTTAANAVTAAEPAIAQAEAAVSQATTQVEASAAATLATGALPGATIPPAPPAGNGLGNGPSGSQPPSA